MLRPDILLAQILFPEKDGVTQTFKWRFTSVQDRVWDFQSLRKAEPDKLLDPLNKWILEVCKAHCELGEGLVESEPIFIVKLSVIVDADASYFHEVLEESLRWLPS